MLLEFAAASCCCLGSSRVRLVSLAGAPGPHEVISGTFPVEPTPARSAQPGVGNCLGTPTPRRTVTPRRLAFDGLEDAASPLACELDYPPGFEPTSGARSSLRDTTARPPLSTTMTFSDASTPSPRECFASWSLRRFLCLPSRCLHSRPGARAGGGAGGWQLSHSLGCLLPSVARC